MADGVPSEPNPEEDRAELSFDAQATSLAARLTHEYTVPFLVSLLASMAARALPPLQVSWLGHVAPVAAGLAVTLCVWLFIVTRTSDDSAGTAIRGAAASAAKAAAATTLLYCWVLVRHPNSSWVLLFSVFATGSITALRVLKLYRACAGYARSTNGPQRLVRTFKRGWLLAPVVFVASLALPLGAFGLPALERDRPKSADQAPATSPAVPNPDPRGPTTTAAEEPATNGGASAAHVAPTSVAPPANGTCTTDAVAAQLVKALGPWVGGQVADRYRALSSKIAGCLPSSESVQSVGPNLMQLRLEGGTLGRTIILASTTGEFAILSGDFAAFATALLAGSRVFRVKLAVDRNGVSIYLFQNIDGSCAMLYQHDATSPVQVLDSNVAPLALLVMLAHQQIGQLSVTTVAPGITLVELVFDAQHGAETVRFSYDSTTRTINVIQSREALTDPKICPESSKVGSLSSPP